MPRSSLRSSFSTPMPADLPKNPRRFVVGVSGASGAAYALRLLEQLLTLGHEVHLVVSEYGHRLLAEEAGVRRVTVEDLVPTLAGNPAADRLIIHPNKD